MTTITVDASEFEALTVRMRRNVGRVGAQGVVVVRKFTLQTEAYAVVGCPVDTGYLRGTIHSSFSGDGRSGEASGSVVAGASYAGYVEWGTSRMAPQPFMGPALARATPGFVRACEQLGGGIVAGGRR